MTSELLDGRYRLESRLGAGGHATVWLATHVQLERDVAIKLLDRPKNKEERKRFLQEAKLLARLEHPNLTRIYDFGFYDGRPYIAMERLKGKNLATYVEERGPFGLSRALALFTPAVRALQLAHENQVVHKDLKPSNLFLVDPDTPNERLKVMDFGTARVGEDRHTRMDKRTGTAQYLPPEYVSEGKYRPASDVYQLAITLCEILTGQPLVTETGLKAMERHVRGDLTLPPALEGGAIGSVLETALRTNYKHRYPDAAAFAQALDAIRGTSAGARKGATPADALPKVRLDDPGRLSDVISLSRASREFDANAIRKMKAKSRSDARRSSSLDAAAARNQMLLLLVLLVVIIVNVVVFAVL